MKHIVTGIGVLMLAAVVQAQTGIAGKWQGETKNGAQIVLDVTVTKSTLTGTITQNGQPMTIADGKVAKNTFTFSVALGERTEGFTGELEGDQITLWIDRRGKDNAAILKRVKK